MGIRPMVESRWLNAVSAYVRRGLVSRVANLAFVRGLRPVGRAGPVASTSLLPHHAGTTTAGSVLTGISIVDPDYGAAATQLDLVSDIPLLQSGIDGTGTRLGFLDTEFGNFEHPVFRRLVDEGRLIATRNFAQGPQASQHGLSVASVAVGYLEGSLIGPAHGAEVLAATTEYVPTETNQEEDQFVAGLEWLESQGADVVNVSLSYTEFDAGERSYMPSDMDGNTGVTTVAADRAASLGVVVVASAGNDGCFSPDDCWYFVGTPADGDSVIAVGGVDSSGNRVSFSSRGPTADGRIKPDVAAMATSVFLAAPGNAFGLSAGTSFSSPMVAAIACQLLQINPRLTPFEVREILRSTASHATAPDNNLGWGIVNASAAAAVASVVHPATDPSGAGIAAVFPNPASEFVVFVVAAASEPVAATISIFDTQGRLVAQPLDGSVEQSNTFVRWQPGRLAAGVYLYRAAIGDRVDTGTIVLM
jgi:hypothetical protein